MTPLRWIVRDWFYADDLTRLRSQLAKAKKEYNACGETDVDVQDWRRRVGEWCD